MGFDVLPPGEEVYGNEQFYVTANAGKALNKVLESLSEHSSAQIIMKVFQQLDKELAKMAKQTAEAKLTLQSKMEKLQEDVRGITNQMKGLEGQPGIKGDVALLAKGIQSLLTSLSDEEKAQDPFPSTAKPLAQISQLQEQAQAIRSKMNNITP